MFKLHTYLQRYAQQQQIKLLRSVLKHTIQRTQLFPKDIYRGHSMQSPLPAHTVASHPNLASHQRSKTMVSARSCSILCWQQQTRTWCWLGSSSEPNINLSKAANNNPHYSFQPCFSTSSWTFSWFFFFIYSSTDPLGSSAFLQLLTFIRDLLLYFTALGWWGHAEFQHFIHETPSLTLPLLHTSESLLHLWKAQPETRLALLNMWIMKKMY